MQGERGDFTARWAEWWRALVPPAALVIVFGAYRCFYNLAGLDMEGDLDQRLNWSGSAPSLESSVGGTLGRLGWGLSGMAFVLAWLLAVSGCLVILTRSLADRSRSSRLGAATGVLAVAGVVSLHSLHNKDPLTLESAEPLLIKAFGCLGLDAGPPLLYLFTSLAFGALVLLAGSAGVTLVRPRDPMSPRELRRRGRRLRAVLYLGAALLAAGVIHTTALHHVPSALLADVQGDTIESLGHGISVATATLWSLMLLAIYLPAALVQRGWGRALVHQAMPEAGEKDRHGWLAARGLISSPTQEVGQLLAILSPLLAGGPLTTLFELIAG